MQEQEAWVELCRAAMNEKDPDKLLKLTEEINRLLEEREQRLRKRRSDPDI
jgi:hypothetical protein